MRGLGREPARAHGNLRGTIIGDACEQARLNLLI